MEPHETLQKDSHPAPEPQEPDHAPAHTFTKNVVKQAFIKSLPVMAGYLTLGIGFGIYLSDIGLGPLWALAMSLFIYAGSMQYAGVSLIESSASILMTILMTVIINARHLFYSISMITKYKGAGKKKPYLIFSLTDETYALLSDGSYPEGEDKYTYWFLISLFDHSYWVIGSVAGSILARTLAFNSAGIDFSMTALFVASFTQQWMETKNHIPALTGFLVTLICLWLFGTEYFLIPALILIMGLMIGLRNTKVMNRKGSRK